MSEEFDQAVEKAADTLLTEGLISSNEKTESFHLLEDAIDNNFKGWASACRTVNRELTDTAAKHIRTHLLPVFEGMNQKNLTALEGQAALDERDQQITSLRSRLAAAEAEVESLRQRVGDHSKHCLCERCTEDKQIEKALKGAP